ncbi:MAG: PKD domain-containing protein [Nitrospirota bacterium]|nr:PKD domain-containing protein [Nitrospirota bacterium]
MHRLVSLHACVISSVLALIILCGSQSAWSFSIREPQASSVYQAGQHMSVALDLQNLPGVTKVHYYWYGEDEDMLKTSGEEKVVLVATAKSSPPFGGNILVPQEAIGRYRLLAVAEQGGRQSKHQALAIFDEVLITIEPDAQLLDIDFQTDKPLRFGRAGGVRVYDQLDSLGTTFELPVMGEFSDGVIRAIRRQTTGTTYHSSNEQIITVNQDGVLRLMGNGKTTLTVNNRNQAATLSILVEINEEPNQPPVSNAGATQTISAGERVTLNGLASYDPDGGSLQYHWAQVRGSKIPLLDPYSAQAKFLAPFVSEERTFRFKLRVTDIKGADSQASYVDVIIQP